MPTPPDPHADAFRALQRRLRARRLAALEPVLRVELALLALLLGAFLFLQVRGPFEIVREQRGAAALAGVVALVALGLAVIAAQLVAARHARRLRRPEGPAWLALPLDAAAVGRHLAWESRAQVGWVVVPALVVFVATIGLLPVAALAGLALAQAALLAVAGRAGAALGAARAARRAAPRPGATPLERVLVDASHGASARADYAPPRWKRASAGRALLDKDARVLVRQPALRQGALAVAALAAVSLLGWLLPGEPGHAAAAPATTFDYRNLATFFVTLLCAGALADEMVRLVGSDPFATLRALPLGLRDAWSARAAWVALVGLALVVGHGLLAHGLAPGARALFLTWVLVSVAGIGLLGVHYAMTLYPRVEAAGQLLGLSFALMAIASIAFFLSGWIVLVGLVAYTARRLPRWEKAMEN